MSFLRARTVLIGLDAAAGDLLFEGCEQGLYPNLAALRDRGAWGIAEGLPGFGSGAIWPSFSTGVNPAKHGRYFYRQVGSAGYGASSARWSFLMWAALAAGYLLAFGRWRACGLAG